MLVGINLLILVGEALVIFLPTLQLTLSPIYNTSKQEASDVFKPLTSDSRSRLPHSCQFSMPVAN